MGHDHIEEALVLLVTFYFSKDWCFSRSTNVQSNLPSKENLYFAFSSSSAPSLYVSSSLEMSIHFSVLS